MPFSKENPTDRIHIVIVDDEQNVVDGLAYLLIQEGYEVHAARNGAAALELVMNIRPALIITDFMMPVMSGLELAVEVKKREQIKDIPIILASGAHTAAARAREDLFERIFQKPYRAAQLLESIDAILQPDRRGPPSP